MLKMLFTYRGKSLKLTEDLNRRLHCASSLKHASLNARPGTWTGFQEEREALRNLLSFVSLVAVTSIKERTSGCLHGAGTNENTTLCHRFRDHVLPSAAQGTFALSRPSHKCL